MICWFFEITRNDFGRKLSHSLTFCKIVSDLSGEFFEWLLCFSLRIQTIQIFWREQALKNIWFMLEDSNLPIVLKMTKWEDFKTKSINQFNNSRLTNINSKSYQTVILFPKFAMFEFNSILFHPNNSIMVKIGRILISIKFESSLI